MSANKQTGKTAAKIIGYILIILVIVGVIGVIVRFTGGFTSEFKTFYVTVDGKDVLTSTGGFETTPKEPLTVEIKYTFGSSGGDVSGYSVKVVPHIVENKDFDFTLDGQVYSYQAETDLTAGFEIERGETSFTLTPKGGVTEVLRAVYPNYEVGDCTGKGYEDMYELVVTSYNGKANVSLYFSVLEKVTSIELDQSEILF